MTNGTHLARLRDLGASREVLHYVNEVIFAKTDDYIDVIVKTVAKSYNLHHRKLHENTRKRDIVEPRQVAQCLATEFTTLSLTDIGLRIGLKDHATVLHAKRTVGNLCETDKYFDNRYKWIREAVVFNLDQLLRQRTVEGVDDVVRDRIDKAMEAIWN